VAAACALRPKDDILIKRINRVKYKFNFISPNGSKQKIEDNNDTTTKIQ